MSEKYYTIDSNKLEKVVEIVNQKTDPAATADLIETEICADWNEGQEHQDWINNASADEIANWLASFYSRD